MTYIPGLIDGAVELVKRFFPDKTEAEQRAAAERMAEASQYFELMKGQQEINKVEAANSSVFVAGWRPFIGWVCGSAFAYGYLLQPFLLFIMAAIGHPLYNLPELNMSEMIPILGGMLGLGWMRTQEKIKGVHGEH